MVRFLNKHTFSKEISILLILQAHYTNMNSLFGNLWSLWSLLHPREEKNCFQLCFGLKIITNWILETLTFLSLFEEGTVHVGLENEKCKMDSYAEFVTFKANRSLISVISSCQWPVFGPDKTVYIKPGLDLAKLAIKLLQYFTVSPSCSFIPPPPTNNPWSFICIMLDTIYIQ